LKEVGESDHNCIHYRDIVIPDASVFTGDHLAEGLFEMQDLSPRWMVEGGSAGAEMEISFTNSTLLSISEIP
jgi:hypothetical protein